MCVPAGGTDECEGNKLVPEGVILRYGLCAHQGLQALVAGQMADLAGVGAHLCSLLSHRLTTLQSVFTGYMTSPAGQEMLKLQGGNDFAAHKRAKNLKEQNSSLHFNRQIKHLLWS